MSNEFDDTVDGARNAQTEGTIGDWVRHFLGSDGSDNAVLGDELRAEKAIWHGPIELPFDELNRLAGPPDQPTLDRLDDDDIETVEGMADSIDDGWQPPPLIVSINDHGEFEVEDGNHRIEGLRRSGHDRYWALVGFDDEAQRDDFLLTHPAG